MKKYPLEALALFGANGFMRGMAKTVLGLARFRSFELFEDEAAARRWLERADSPSAAAAPAPPSGGASGLKRLAVPAGLLTSVALLFRLRRRRSRVV
jgi:hypothetical protein